MFTETERAELMRRANAEPERHAPVVETVYHFSDDGSIRRFAPHIPPSNPAHLPAVWAIDAAHSPLYWFPRRCPRISVWANDADEQRRLSDVFGTEASRVCAAETGWLGRVRSARVYRYVFDAAGFRRWADADGQYISEQIQRPQRIDVLDDLLTLHADAHVELRFTPRLGALMDQILASQLPFSFVRIRDARR